MNPDNELLNEFALEIKVNFNGSGSLFCGFVGRTSKATDKEPEVKFFYDEIAAYNTTRFIAFFGYLYEYTSYLGMVDIGVAVTGLDNAIWDYTNQRQFRMVYRHPESEYFKIVRVSALTLKENPKKIASDLLMRLITTISQGKSNPFNS